MKPSSESNASPWAAAPGTKRRMAASRRRTAGLARLSALWRGGFGGEFMGCRVLCSLEHSVSFRRGPPPLGSSMRRRACPGIAPLPAMASAPSALGACCGGRGLHGRGVTALCQRGRDPHGGGWLLSPCWAGAEECAGPAPRPRLRHLPAMSSTYPLPSASAASIHSTGMACPSACRSASLAERPALSASAWTVLADSPVTSTIHSMARR